VSTKITGYSGSSGRLDHSASSPATFSVILLIVSLDTFDPYTSSTMRTSSPLTSIRERDTHQTNARASAMKP
jgi:hypothetical protein